MATPSRNYINACIDNAIHSFLSYALTKDKKWNEKFKPWNKDKLTEEDEKELKIMYLFWITKGIDIISREYKSWRSQFDESILEDKE